MHGHSYANDMRLPLPCERRRYDLADWAALVLTPTVVTAFVWRDGSFSLEGTGILVRRCDLPHVWGRFVILLVLRPAASRLARFWLDRNMGRAMTGKPTLHGASPLGVEIFNAATQLHISSRAAFDDLVHTKLRDVRTNLNLTDAEYRVVREELSLRNLEYRQLSYGMLRTHYRFYTAVIIFQLFAAFPVHATLPSALADTQADWRADWRAWGVTNATAEAWSPRNVTLLSDDGAHAHNDSLLSSSGVHGTVRVPSALVWLHVPPRVALAFAIDEGASQLTCDTIRQE